MGIFAPCLAVLTVKSQQRIILLQSCVGFCGLMRPLCEVKEPYYIFFCIMLAHQIYFGDITGHYIGLIIIIIRYIYIALFWVLKALYIEVGNLLNHH